MQTCKTTASASPCVILISEGPLDWTQPGSDGRVQAHTPCWWGTGPLLTRLPWGAVQWEAFFEHRTYRAAAAISMMSGTLWSESLHDKQLQSQSVQDFQPVLCSPNVTSTAGCVAASSCETASCRVVACRISLYLVALTSAAAAAAARRSMASVDCSWAVGPKRQDSS